MMLVDAKTDKKVNSKTKQSIIEAFKIPNIKTERLSNIDSRLNSTNILKFY